MYTVQEPHFTKPTESNRGSSTPRVTHPRESLRRLDRMQPTRSVIRSGAILSAWLNRLNFHCTFNWPNLGGKSMSETKPATSSVHRRAPPFFRCARATILRRARDPSSSPPMIEAFSHRSGIHWDFVLDRRFNCISRPFQIMERRGLPWVVATDCGVSNDTMNVQQELRLVAGLGSPRPGPPNTRYSEVQTAWRPRKMRPRETRQSLQRLRGISRSRNITPRYNLRTWQPSPSNFSR